MSDVPAPPQPPGPQPQRSINELKVSAHLMTLEQGLFCIVQTPSRVGESGLGLPGVRITTAPNSGRDVVSVATFRPDGWLGASGDAALVRVSAASAQLLVTIYQAPNASEAAAPNLQVMKLFDGGAPAAAASAPRPQAAPSAAQPALPSAPVAPSAPAQRPNVGRGPAVMEMVAHIQERGDVGAMLGDWLGERGSKRWIEGFGLAPSANVPSKEIEYQAVLGPGWLSPWVEGGQFCGSRAMALPLLGLRVRLRGAAANAYDAVYSATFVDGTAVGPVENGEPCESDTLAAMEAFQVILRPRAERIERAAAPRAAATPLPPVRPRVEPPAVATRPPPRPLQPAAMPAARSAKPPGTRKA